MSDLASCIQLDTFSKDQSPPWDICTQDRNSHALLFRLDTTFSWLDV